MSRLIFPSRFVTLGSRLPTACSLVNVTLQLEKKKNPLFSGTRMLQYAVINH